MCWDTSPTWRGHCIPADAYKQHGDPQHGGPYRAGSVCLIIGHIVERRYYNSHLCLFMQIRTGFSLGQGSELQGILQLMGDFVSFLALHLVQSSNTGFWSGARMPMELLDSDKAPLCVWPHYPFRNESGEETGRTLFFFF